MNLDPHQRSSWLVYAILMAFYTFVVFCMPFNGKKAPLFSDRKMKPPSALVLTHVNFLMVLLLSIWLASFVGQTLPRWMTKEILPSRGGDSSVAEILYLLFFVVLSLIERLFIYSDSDPKDTDPENESS